MTHIIKASFFLLLVLLLPDTAFAYDFEVDGIYYNINGNEATATGEYCNYSGDVTIPRSVTFNGTTYPVTAIGDSAFYCCGDLSSVTIPNSVTSIGDAAFEFCGKLTSINIPNSVTSIGSGAFENTAWFNNQPDGLVYAGLVAYKYKGTMPYGTSISLRDGTPGIAGGAFYGCRGLSNINIPNSVTSIGGFAFYECNSLTNVSIPNSIMTIGNGAFAFCSGLASIDIPNSLTTISEGLFYSCSGLTSLTIPNSVTTIGLWAFNGCSGLTSIDIPNSVTNIEDQAFLNCYGLTSINIPNAVTSIGETVFGGCYGLASITVDSENVTYDSRNNCNAIIETASNSLIAGCSSTICPNSITTIGSGAFVGCNGLKNITIPNSVTSIGDYAFSGCSGLTSVTIPNSVASIGNYAFAGCIGLTRITCYAMTPPSLSSSSFENYNAVLQVPRNCNNAYLSANYWNHFSIIEMHYDFEFNGIYYAITGSNTVAVTYKDSNDNSYSGNVTIPSNVTFNGTTYSVTSIGEQAFSWCTELHRIK